MLIRINWNPNRRELRQFGWVVGACFVLVGALVGWRWGAWRAGGVLMALGPVLLAVSLCLPPLGRMVYRAWMGVGFCLGTVMGPVFLALVYYGVFTPVGLLMRLAGRRPIDPRRPDKLSFWRDVAHRTDTRSYERQF